MGKRILLCVFLLALAACGQVRSPGPVGPYPAKVDSRQLEGMWLSTYGGISVSVVATDAERGRFAATWLEPDKKGADHIQRVELAFRSSEEGGTPEYLSLRLAPDYDSLEDAQGWMPVAFEFDPKAQFARFLIPDVDKFKEAVSAGVLAGTVGEQNISLGPLDPDQLKQMFSTYPVFLPLFHHDFPFYDFKRVSETPRRSLLYPIEFH